MPAGWNGTRLVSVCAVVLGLVALTPTPVIAADPRCQASGARTLAMNEVARVVELRRGSAASVLACTFRSNKFFSIGDNYYARPDAIAAVKALRLTRRYVGVLQEGSGKSGAAANALVYDLRLRRLKWIVGVSTGAGDAPTRLTATDLELAPNGAVAGLFGIEDDGTTRYELRKTDSSGTNTLVDTGTIEPDSLAASGRNLYWTRNGPQRVDWAAPAKPRRVSPIDDGGRFLPGCRQSGSQTLLADSRRRIYRYKRRLVSCSFASRKRQTYLPPYVDYLQLAGRYLGYSWGTCGSGGTCSSGGNIWNLSKAGPAGAGPGGWDVEDLLLRRTGVSAGIVFRVDTFKDPWERSRQIQVVSADGQRMVAEENLDIEPLSLALSGSTLYWTAGGRPRSAVLGR